MRVMEEFKYYPPIHKIFEVFREERDAVFLESSMHSEQGRFSVIGLYPYLKLVKKEQFTVNGEICERPFEEYVKEYLKENQEDNPTNLPLIAGAVGYFSYDYGQKRMGLASRKKSRIEIPDSILCFYDVFIVEDSLEKKLYFIANGKLIDGKVRLEQLKKQIESESGICDPVEDNSGAWFEADFQKEEYMEAVSEMSRYIAEGDIYMGSLAQQIRLKSTKEPYLLFQSLRRINPSPFGGYFNYGDFQIISSSPERFVGIRDGRVVASPVKGTRKRGKTLEEDMALRNELRSSEKEKSELLMIAKLVCDELNQVCIPGSVEITELFEVEEYAAVFHLVSQITGLLRENLTAMDLLEAAFPGGAVTGAPKQRAMEIIDKLEHSKRNLYTGSLGYLSLNGDCDFNIVIQTAVFKDQTYYLGTGAGVAEESEPEFEYEEAFRKAGVVMEALNE
ncbi:Para-aminobenzoate synthase component 1 [uncultured Roseburia sp.]|uniref:Anthranilate synthase component 1 n=1 Tax=Brotonthovivens ammoniilytica TaxID=2981725 RepID=A0ABT2TM82_9FIRM|nr:anthranilate synthase component I family protein [Brotonthovivens ammoniilytica]MCU6763266.1 anthranilate synthase component I family protein [Brotonthovivens ammoniilytica]SCJ11374.1 Para-aminobenzoate synthase component 1 [uncultured Roseburia sp.]